MEKAFRAKKLLMNSLSSILVLLFSFLLLTAEVQMDSDMVYYADYENPPVSNQDPEFQGSRRLIEHEKLPSLYLNIRYPRQNEPGGKIEFLISVGHEITGMLLFEVKKLELRHQGIAMTLSPSFLNQSTNQTEEGMEALLSYRHRVPSYDHRRIQVTCEDCHPDFEKMDLTVQVLMISTKGQVTLGDTISLYRGKFRRR